MQQLCVGSLVESNTKRQVYAHDPEFCRTGKVAFEHVHHIAEEQIDMEGADTADDERYVSNTKIW